MLKPRARKKHQPLGFSIRKFQSSHPPQKNKQIKHKIQGSVIFSLSRGEPPKKNHHWPILRPISCASGNRLGKVHFLNKRHVEQKGEATKKKL